MFKSNKSLFSKIVLSIICLFLIFSLSIDYVEAADDTVVIAIPNEPETLDVHKITARMTRKIQYLMNDPLVHQDPETLEYIPHLAKDWEISDDELVWTFYLREDVEFHNGEPLTAYDYEYTFNRILDPETAATYAADDVGPLERVEVVDDYTFELHFEAPYAPLLHYLAHGQLQPLNENAVEAQGEDYGTNPVDSGVGPFVFENWDTGENITFVRNEDYNWGPAFYENQGPPEIERIEIRVVPDIEVSTMGLFTREIDGADFIADKDVQSLLQDPQIEMHQISLPGIGLYSAFNVTEPPFDDLDVRIAANHAVNKETIINVVKYGNANKAYGPIPDFFVGFHDGLVDYYEHDPEKANEILDEAGWERGEDGIREKDGQRLEGDFLVRDRDDYIMTAQLLQEMYRDIGMELEIQILEWATLTDSIFDGAHNYTLMGHGHGESDVLYTLFHSDSIGGFNLAHISDPELDELIELQRTTTDIEEREEIIKEIQEIVMMEEALWVPIYNDIEYYPINKRVEGVMVHPLQWYLFNDAEIVE